MKFINLALQGINMLRKRRNKQSNVTKLNPQSVSIISTKKQDGAEGNYCYLPNKAGMLFPDCYLYKKNKNDTVIIQSCKPKYNGCLKDAK